MKKPIILHWSESKDYITKLKKLKCKHKGMEPQMEDRAYSGFSFYMRCRLMVGHHPQIFLINKGAPWLLNKISPAFHTAM